ncbi:MAG: PilZ domain-containing protein [Candidatus Omnitrophica bacterium]|nr:PilZ domain-containing protein [Candidatus Omnitrophota bacterium]
MEERRKYVRVNKSFAVSYKPLGQFIKPSCTTKNISLGGICLAIYHRLSPSTSIKMWITLRDFKNPIVATGTVLWIKDTGDPAFPWQVGIKFIEINPTDKRILMEQIRIICEEDKIPYVGPLD